MPVHNIFPTPVYAKQLLGSKQGEINQELYSVYKPDKMVKNTHTYNHTSSHQVSCDDEGNMFSTNIVKEYVRRYLCKSNKGGLKTLFFYANIYLNIISLWIRTT